MNIICEINHLHINLTLNKFSVNKKNSLSLKVPKGPYKHSLYDQLLSTSTMILKYPNSNRQLKNVVNHWQQQTMASEAVELC